MGLGSMESEDVEGELGCVEGGEVVEEVEQFLLRSLGVEEGSVKGGIEETRVLMEDRLGEDAEELFGRHIAANLRRLTNRQKAEAKVCIQQVMIDIEFPADAGGSQTTLY